MRDICDGRSRPHRITRRRTLLIAGAAIGSALTPGPIPVIAAGKFDAAPPRLHRWRGTVLGGDATLSLHGLSGKAARRLFQHCVDEVGRLEDIFSLYRPDSALSRLNRDGRLLAPPGELVALLSECSRIADITGGAFDVTVQALWNVYARHFSRRDPDPAGPGEAERDRARALVDYKAVEVNPRRIAFGRPGMAVTLNGIAQGYITDRIVDLLRRHGMRNVFVDLGETRTLGRHPSGRPWKIGLVDPIGRRTVAHTLTIGSDAVATSGGYGAGFDTSGRHHHLFDPLTGASATHNAAVTVIAPAATTADALSTALSVMPCEQASACLNEFDGTRAIITRPDGSILTTRAERTHAKQ